MPLPHRFLFLFLFSMFLSKSKFFYAHPLSLYIVISFFQRHLCVDFFLTFPFSLHSLIIILLSFLTYTQFSFEGYIKREREGERE